MCQKFDSSTVTLRANSLTVNLCAKRSTVRQLINKLTVPWLDIDKYWPSFGVRDEQPGKPSEFEDDLNVVSLPKVQVMDGYTDVSCFPMYTLPDSRKEITVKECI